MTKNKPTIAELESAAEREDWEFVDNNIKAVANDKPYIDWAFSKGIRSSHANIRDLGATILEKAKISAKQFALMRQPLAHLMDDGKGYDSFRAACALAAHGAGEYNESVERVLRRFAGDVDVGNIAKKYLKRR